MKAILSERNLVIVLFIMVFITFSLAHEDSKKMEKAYTGLNASAVSHMIILEEPAPNKSFVHPAFLTE